jgi:molybdopterin-guanine dinucleotide biosynthesis protein A
MFEGETLLERAARTLGSVVDDVVVAGGDRELPGIVRVRDAVEGAGPLAGVVSAMHVARGGPVLVLAVDLPTVTPDLLRSCARALVRSDQAVIVRQGTTIQPLCGAYGAGLAHLAHERLSSDDRSMRAFLDRVPLLSILDVADDSIWNLNTPEDYERLVG